MLNFLLTTFLTINVLLGQYYYYYDTEYVIADGVCKGKTYTACASFLKTESEAAMLLASQSPAACAVLGNEWTNKVYFGQLSGYDEYHCQPYYVPECDVRYVGLMPEVYDCRWVLSALGKDREHKKKLKEFKKWHRNLNKQARQLIPKQILK